MKSLQVREIYLGRGVKTGIVSPFTSDQMGITNYQQDKITDVQQAFARVPLLNRAFHLRVDGLQRVPVQFFEGNKKIDSWIFEDSIPFKEWLAYAESGLLLRGGSWTLLLKDESGNPTGETQQLNPFTINVERVPVVTDGQQKLVTAFWQQLPQGRFPRQGYWYEDEMLYLKTYNPSDDIGPGVPEAMVALRSAQVQHYLTVFAATFFENGAMPTMFLGLPEDTEPAEVERVENWVKTAITGIRKAWRVKALRGELKPVILTPDFYKLDLPGLEEKAILDIASAFKIEKSLLLSDASTYATAIADYRKFAAYTLSGRCEFYTRRLNKFLGPFGQRAQFNVNELPEMQEDEANRSQAFKNYVEGGMKPQLAARVLGVDIPEEYAHDFYDVQKPGESVEPTTINLPRAQQVEDANTLPAAKAALLKADLNKFMKKSLLRFEETKNADVEFKSDIIPLEAMNGIHAVLKKVKDDAQIKYLFRNVIASISK